MANLYITGSTAVTTITLTVAGVLTNFDALPTCILVGPNRTTTLATATVSNVSTGVYQAVFTVPDGIQPYIEFVAVTGAVATRPMAMREPIQVDYATGA